MKSRVVVVKDQNRIRSERQSGQHRKACLITAISTFLLLLLAVLLFRNPIGGGGGGGGGDNGDGRGGGIGAHIGAGVQQGKGSNITPDAIPISVDTHAETSRVDPVAVQADMVLTDRLVMATVVINPGAPPPTATPGGVDAGSGGGQGGGSGGGRGSGTGSGEGSGVGETKFMGIKAEGRTFIYVVDCSGSMLGKKLDETKSELMASIRMLTSRQQQFFVFFYDDQTYPWPGPQKLKYALLHNIRNCEAWIRSISGGGGTAPAEALLAAISMNPDVIFFMSDGQFDDAICDTVRIARGNKPMAIHTISFVDKSGEAVMRRIAEENRGKYRFEPSRNTSP